MNADGSATETISTLDSQSRFLDRSVTTTSGNGLATTSQLDVDGNGSNDKIRSKTIDVDGASTELVELKSQSGSLLQKQVVTKAANGLSAQAQFDTNGDGAFDRVHTKTINGDRSVTDTWVNMNPNGSLDDKVVTTTGANGLSKTVQVDSTGDGASEIVTATIVTENADGNRTSVISKTNGAGSLLSRTTTTTSDDGLTSSSAIDSNGDGTTDRTATSTTVLHADGTKTTTIVSNYADNTLHKKIVVAMSADGRTTISQIDSDGNGVNDKVITSVTNADEPHSATTQWYASTGTVASSMTMTTSADGLTTTRQWSNGVSETTEFLAGASGSYVWTQSQGSTSFSVAHAVSLNGVDTWTSNEGGVVRTVRIDLEAKQLCLDLTDRIYGVVLNRQMTARESETLLEYVSDGC